MINRDDYPSNNYNSSSSFNQNKDKIKDVKKLVNSEVKVSKKGWGDKFKDLFFSDVADSVGRYILHDVLVPAAKDIVINLIQGKSYSGGSNYNNKSYTQYSSLSRNSNVYDFNRTNRKPVTKDFDNIVVSTRQEGEDVICALIDLIRDYRQATLPDLYQMVGIKGNYTDIRYGWTDLHRASVDPVRDGYLLNLPRPQLLD